MPKHELHIQDPRAADPTYLVDLIAEAAETATDGVGVFAFASQRGVDLLLEEDSVANLFRRGTFRLIVGIDAVTNRATLEHLRKCASRHPGLEPRVFWNTLSGLFHPKLCYFRGEKRHTAIIGSGNLTPGGLRDHFEAYSVVRGRPREMANLDAHLNAFLALAPETIREIDDEALARAARNLHGSGLAKRITERDAGGETTGGKVPERDRMLVAELPSHGSRWQQAAFDLDSIRDFFRADATSPTKRLVFLNEVADDGTLGRDETHPYTLSATSRNSYIALAARAGEKYPSDGRPITVFHEIKRRHFHYLVRLPGEPGYAPLSKMLASVSVASRRMRRKIVSAKDLSITWSACPLFGVHDGD